MVKMRQRREIHIHEWDTTAISTAHPFDTSGTVLPVLILLLLLLLVLLLSLLALLL